MSEQQYKRASKVVYSIIVIVFGYIAVTMVAWLQSTKDAILWKTAVQMIAAFAHLNLRYILIGNIVVLVANVLRCSGAYGHRREWNS